MAWNVMCPATTGVVLETGSGIVVMNPYTSHILDRRVTMAGITAAAIDNTVYVLGSIAESQAVCVHMAVTAITGVLCHIAGTAVQEVSAILRWITMTLATVRDGAVHVCSGVPGRRLVETADKRCTVAVNVGALTSCRVVGRVQGTAVVCKFTPVHAGSADGLAAVDVCGGVKEGDASVTISTGHIYGNIFTVAGIGSKVAYVGTGLRIADSGSAGGSSEQSSSAGCTCGTVTLLASYTSKIGAPSNSASCAGEVAPVCRTSLAGGS